jgi:hypothetical protein
MSDAVRVAGVTFDNEPAEGGRNRQTILAELIGHPFDAVLKRAIFKNDRGEEEPAIKVYHADTKEMIGWIPRVSITDLWNVPRMVGFADYYKNTFGCSLEYQHDPTPKQYAIVTKLVAQGKIAKPTVYDRDVYRRAICRSRSKHTD